MFRPLAASGWWLILSIASCVHEKMPVQSCQNLTGHMLDQYTVVNEYICTTFVMIGTVHMKMAPRVYIIIVITMIHFEIATSPER